MVMPAYSPAYEDLVPLVYAQLRLLADRYVRRDPQATLHPTELVHEAWLKLEKHEIVGHFEGREHYAAVAARAMRQVLMDRARGRGRLKRGARPIRTTLSAVVASGPEVDVVDLNHALDELARHDMRAAQVVELRYFGGMSADEIGRCLEISPRTVQTTWRLARAWLVQRLGAGG